MAELLVQCSVAPGVFSTEFLISIKRADGSLSFTYLDSNLVQVKRTPARGEKEEGKVAVDLLAVKGENATIRLRGTDGMFESAGLIVRKSSLLRGKA
jgi:hypothetical protein